MAVFAQQFAALRREQCPGLVFQVLEQDEYSISYYVAFPACNEQEPQAEVTRLIQGNDGIHRISYSEKGGGLDHWTQQDWLAQFRTAYVAKGEDRVPIR